MTSIHIYANILMLSNLRVREGIAEMFQTDKNISGGINKMTTLTLEDLEELAELSDEPTTDQDLQQAAHGCTPR